MISDQVPIPNHLKDIVVALPESTVTKLYASLRCLCGENRFEFSTVSSSKIYDGERIPVSFELDGRFYFLIEAHCKACGRTHLVFDKDFHGWDAYVCNYPDQKHIARPLLAVWQCAQCDHTSHSAQIQISFDEPDNEDLIDRVGQYREDYRIEGFGYFAMAITCASCGHQVSDWVGYETM